MCIGTIQVDKLALVASKHTEWATLPYSKKLDLLQQMIGNLTALDFDEFLVGVHGKTEAAMMGYPDDTPEGQLEATSSALLYTAVVKTVLDRLVGLYKIHMHKMKKPTFRTSTSPITGQTIIQTSPVLAADKFGQFANCSAEVWLEPSEKEAHFFQMEHLREDGLKLVLGAGNITFLSISDCLFALFQEHRVVYLKHHPLRGHQEIVLRKILDPLISRGYFEMEVDTGVKRSKELVYHPDVAAVHLTGGKQTHDAIVWGNQEKRDIPILKATITSELGCVTPWLISPQKYSDKELEHQVKHIFASMYINAGGNCNSPKVFVLSKDWEQKDRFITLMQEQCENDVLPNAYYPGTKGRWNGFKEAYPEAKEINSKTGMGVKERKLSPPKMGTEAVLLPWLRVDINVDLETEAGRAQALKEYAFRTEPFAPIITFAYVKDFSTGVKLCNNYMFGSLSCSMTAKEETDEVKQAIADLKYGGICVNGWSAMCYAATGGVWGAFPGEKLEAVESGIGQINNHFMIPHIEKTVMKMPVVDLAQGVREAPLVAANKFRAVGMVLLKPGIYTISNLIAVFTIGVRLPPPKYVIPFTFVSIVAIATIIYHKMYIVGEHVIM